MKFGLVSLRADAQGSPGRRIVSARKTSQTGPESCAVHRDGIFRWTNYSLATFGIG